MRTDTGALLHTSDVARILGVAETTVYLWERKGRLRALRTSRGVRLFDPREIERVARERHSKLVSE
ncbi:MAG: MerR family transcriptional regulator [Dehalococcoidia bacterium]